MSKDFNPAEWITTKEAAELTGYSTARFRQLAKRGTVKADKIGRDWLLERCSVLEWAEEMKRLGPAKHDPWRTGARSNEGEED
ncbi:MAG: helix-turn-helix domain-containing protein [Chloroflexota bacterium]